MATATTKSSTYPQPSSSPPPQYPYNQSDPPGLGPRKTLFVLVTVVGCIAILWPKIFYPMMFSTPEVPAPKANYVGKDIRPGGCCGVVLDHEKYANASQEIGSQAGYRKRLNLMTGEISLRQERPPHLRTGHIHPAMIERGRAIPNTQSVPIVADKPQRAQDAPQIIDGRPGPIPGMRPPMGAGSVHQANQKGSSMGLIMPLYTIGIVAFFVYTIMKLVIRKNDPTYPVPKEDPNFKEEVFRRVDNKIPNLGWKDHDTIVTAIQGLIDAADEQLVKQENSKDLSKNATENTKDKSHADSGKTNGHIKNSKHEANGYVDDGNDEAETTNQYIKVEENATKSRHVPTNDKTMKVLGLEMTASCENGKKWIQSPTAILNSTYIHHSSSDSEPEQEPQSIYLEGALPHESQILVSDSQTTPESVEQTENSDEPAVILSSKMTLSLINLDPTNDTGNASNGTDESDTDDKIEDLHGEAY